MTNKKGIKPRKIVLLAIICTALFFCGFFATNGFFGAFKNSETVTVQITAGMNGSDIASMLHKEGVVCSKLVFKGILRISGKAPSVNAGIFELSPKMSYGKILKTLTGYSSANNIKFTVPEGYKLSQVAAVIEKSGLCTAEEFLFEAQNGIFEYNFLQDIPQNDPTRLEGFLFPDTYFIDKNADAHSVINAMLKQFEKVYTEEIAVQAESFGFTTREFITLASVIEKEGTGDLGKISSVFHNRLESGMRLESCATINYLFDEPKDVLSVEDTYIDSPYNTYRNNGLPPTPICSPGKAAIEAAAYPEDTDYLFFVADGNGGNLFSKTFEEHKQKKGNR